MIKGADGLVHLKGGGSAEADASVGIQAGALESSNVNTVEAMVNLIQLARQYETQVKMMKNAEELYGKYLTPKYREDVFDLLKS